MEIHDFVDNRLGELIFAPADINSCHSRSPNSTTHVLGFSGTAGSLAKTLVLPYLKQYADECGRDQWDGFAVSRDRSRRPKRGRLGCGAVHYPAPVAATEINASQARDYSAASTARGQRKALAKRFALGLLRPFSGMNVSVRLGEISQNILSRWPVLPQSPKPTANFRYLTLCGQGNWLMLRESLLSLYRSSSSLPKLTVVSDGSWTSEEFAEVFAWWPAPITVLQRDEVSRAASSAGFPELAKYARESPYRPQTFYDCN